MTPEIRDGKQDRENDELIPEVVKLSQMDPTELLPELRLVFKRELEDLDKKRWPEVEAKTDLQRKALAQAKAELEIEEFERGVEASKLADIRKKIGAVDVKAAPDDEDYQRHEVNPWATESEAQRRANKLLNREITSAEIKELTKLTFGQQLRKFGRRVTRLLKPKN